MKALAIKINLDDDTRKQGIAIDGTVYSFHITDNEEVVITDYSDYTKIFAVYSLDFFKGLDNSEE